MEEAERKQHFEQMHQVRTEPFDYSRSGAEILRHEFVFETARRLVPRPARLLDVGCSLGQLTVRLSALPEVLVAMDLSRAAIARARVALARTDGARLRFVVGSGTAMPFRAGRFDLVNICDGLHSWNLGPEERAAALAESCRVARPGGGYVLLTEYLRPERFAGFEREVRASPLEVAEVAYLYNRPWYQFRTWFKAVRHRAWVRSVLGSVTLARLLRALARPFGPRASRHICIVARRP